MRLSSARQILVGDPLPNDCVHETVKLLQRVTLHLAVIQAEGELIHVTGHMLRARTMVDAIHPALQDGVEAPRVVWAHRGALDLPPALASTSLAEPVKDEPRRFLGNANLFRQLQRRDTFPGRDKQVHGIKPLVQGGISSQELNDAIIVRDGLERVMSLWQQLDEESARNALTELDKSALEADSATDPMRPKVDALVNGISPRRLDLAQMLAVAHDNFRAGGGPPPSVHEITVQLEYVSGIGWIIWALLTFLFGCGVLILSNHGFGTWQDLLKCFLWGLGIQAAGQGLQALTPSSTATTFSLQIGH